MSQKQAKVKKRDLKFDKKTITTIWEEVPSPNNPYLTESCCCHGYDLLELLKKRSFIDVFFLLFFGELPTVEQEVLLESLMIGIINPGPRHPATRATMNSAVSRTNPSHLLPIGLSVLSGDHLGANEVISSMRFLNKNINNDPHKTAELIISDKAPLLEQNQDVHLAPGFGRRFNDVDPMPQKLANYLLELPGNNLNLQWADKFVSILTLNNMGWLNTGVAAAVFCDLGFNYRAGAGLFQIMSAPGVLAHGLELANKPLTAMPFLDEEHYIIDDDGKKV